MALISRIKTWVNELLTPADLNGEFNNVVNTMNNLDSATTAWTNVKTTTLTPTTVTKSFAFSPTTLGVIGTTTNDAATAGNVGEYITSWQNNTSAPTSGQWGDLTSISLTAGDWSVSLGQSGSTNGATITAFNIGVGKTSGNNAPDILNQPGDDSLTCSQQAGGTSLSGSLPALRVSLSATTTIYYKMNASYSVATPIYRGRISAIRIR